MFNNIFKSIIGEMTDMNYEARNAAKLMDSALQTALNFALLSSENQELFKIKEFMICELHDNDS